MQHTDCGGKGNVEIKLIFAVRFGVPLQHATPRIVWRLPAVEQMHERGCA
jgi:hypothetical protein